MAEWCNAYLTVVGASSDVRRFAKHAQKKPPGSLEWIPDLMVSDGEVARLPRPDGRPGDPFIPDMWIGEGGGLWWERAKAMGKGLSLKRYHFQIRNDDGRKHFRNVSRAFPLLHFILVNHWYLPDESRSFLIHAGRSKAYEMPEKLMNSILAKYGCDPDMEWDEEHEDEYEDNYSKGLEASWEMMDVAEAHWLGSLLHRIGGFRLSDEGSTTSRKQAVPSEVRSAATVIPAPPYNVPNMPPTKRTSSPHTKASPRLKRTQSPTAKGLHPLALAYSASVSYDWALYEHDIAASIAHAKMLGKQGIIPRKDAQAIVRGLKEIQKEIEKGEFTWRQDLEDVHLNIEMRLREKIGDAGARLHTARSRNDQVATDMRLAVIEYCGIGGIYELLHRLQAALLDLAEENVGTVIPGYTHLQRAQPVLLAHHLLAYFEMFERDAFRFAWVMASAGEELPLGAGALAGVPYPIDRQSVAEELGFLRVSRNSIDSVSDRDFLVEFHAAAATTMMHISRLAEEIILWSSEEFGFIRLPDEFATGSSIMPQKRNPDIAELARGRTGRVYGNLMAILTTLKGLPLAYNRDLQEDKIPFLETAGIVQSTLAVFTAMLNTLQVNVERAEAAANSGYLMATDTADYLVRKGVPFRDAHQAVAELVRHAESEGKPLSALTLEDYRRFSPQFEEDILGLDARTSIEARDVPGGTATKRVKAAIKEAGRRLLEKLP